MRIGIDIDGVITDMALWYRAYKETVQLLSGKVISDKILLNYFYRPHLTARTMKHILVNVAETEYSKYLSAALYKYYTCQKPRAGFSELTKRLRERGHRIYIITARTENSYESKYVANTSGMSFELFTRLYLVKNGIEFDKYFFDAQDKASVVEKEHIDVMIDDFVGNLESIAKRVPTCRLIKFGYKDNEADVREKSDKFEYAWSVGDLSALLL